MLKSSTARPYQQCTNIKPLNRVHCLIDIFYKTCSLLRDRFLGVTVRYCSWFGHILHRQIAGLTETPPGPAAITEKTILKPSFVYKC